MKHFFNRFLALTVASSIMASVIPLHTAELYVSSADESNVTLEPGALFSEDTLQTNDDSISETGMTNEETKATSSSNTETARFNRGNTSA